MHPPPSSGTPSGFDVYRLSVGSFLLHPRRHLGGFKCRGNLRTCIFLPLPILILGGSSQQHCAGGSASPAPVPRILIPTSRKSPFLSRFFPAWRLQTPSSVREGSTPSHLWLSSPLPNVLRFPPSVSLPAVAIAVTAQGAPLCKNCSVLPGVTSLAHTSTVYNSEFGSPCFCCAPIYHGLSYCVFHSLVPAAPVTPPALQWPCSRSHTQFQLTHGGLRMQSRRDGSCIVS